MEDRDDGVERLVCGRSPEDLVALVWGSLPEAERKELELHAASCEACRTELDTIRAVREALALIPEVRPSETFRARTLSRAKELACKRPSNRLSKLLKREGVISAWLRPRWRILTFGASVAACIAFLVASRFVIIERLSPNRAAMEISSPREVARAAIVRWKERRECAHVREARMEDSTLELKELLAEEEVILTGIADINMNERCLMVFRASDWEGYSRRERNFDRKRLAALEETKRLVRVSGGRLEVPRPMLEQYLASQDVIILRLSDRMEIWSRSAYERYARELPPLIHIDMDELGAFQNYRGTLSFTADRAACRRS